MKRSMNSRYRGRLVVFAAGVALAVLIAGAVTVVSRQNEHLLETERTLKSANSYGSPMTVKPAGQDFKANGAVPVQELTPEEARRLTEAVTPMVNKSSEGLVEVQDADNGVTVDLQDRFQNVTVARRNADGTISQACVDTPQSAAAFFRPDRNTNQFNNQPVRVTPAADIK